MIYAYGHLKGTQKNGTPHRIPFYILLKIVGVSSCPHETSDYVREDTNLKLSFHSYYPWKLLTLEKLE